MRNEFNLRGPFGSDRLFRDEKFTPSPPAFSPASLFANSEQGLIYEPSPSTCFTDTAGTTPAGVGDAVARINDLSGNGNHATQPTAAARPTLQQDGGRYYLALDAVDDWMNVPPAAEGGVAVNNTAVFAVQPDDGQNFPRLLAGSTNHGFVLLFDTTTERIRPAMYTASGPPVTATGITSFTGTPFIYSAVWDRTVAMVQGFANGSSEVFVTAFPANKSGVPAVYQLGANGAGGNLFHGRIYGGFMISRRLADEDRQRVEAYFAARSGVTLP